MNDDFKKDGMTERDFQEMETRDKILRFAAGYEVPFSQSKEEALARLKSRITSQVIPESPKNNRLKMIYIYSSVAAVMLIFIGFWMFLHRPSLTNVIAEKGSHIEYQLPDGSFVSMNAESKMAFEKSRFANKRYLSLEGEAFFKVKKGKAFTIHTKFANVKVLGTSFDVLARENAFKVSCLTGKVLVYSGEQAVIIYPGESTIVTHNRLTKYQDKNIESVANWRQGRYNFENIALNLVFKELERQFNINLVLPELDNKYFTGEFSNKSLTDALDIVCIPMDLTYEIDNNNKIIIKEKEH
ncbi:MAG: FecR family protein [Bacteroidota bacterium]|nr:FecR family protein [Bacteroidota bacterium]